MISILITLLVVCIVAAVVFWIISLLPLPAPWGRVAQAIVGLILLIWLLMWLVPAARVLH